MFDKTLFEDAARLVRGMSVYEKDFPETEATKYIDGEGNIYIHFWFIPLDYLFYNNHGYKLIENSIVEQIS